MKVVKQGISALSTWRWENGATQLDLEGAHLPGVNLEGMDLREANLMGADLKRANLEGTNLEGAQLKYAQLGWGSLANLDLGPLIGAVRHVGPSRVDWTAVARSLRHPGLHGFLVAAGWPDVLATYVIDCCRSVDPQEMFSMLQSTFISYGQPDEAFARKLQEALQENGVRTWFFPEDAVPGQSLHRVMRRGVDNHERVVVICSANSLGRSGVSYELEQSLTKEAKLGGEELIIPVILDRYLFDKWVPKRPEHKEALTERVVADFSDPFKFDESLAKLLKALQK